MKKILIPALLCLTLAAGCTCENTIRRRADVLVIGGTTSGTTAAIAAARQGVQTLVVEETPMLGGMLTAQGVCATDGNFELPSGLWNEFRDRLRKRYGGIGALWTGWVSTTLFEPHVADSIFHAMAAAEPTLEVVHGYRLTGILRRGKRVTGAEFTDARGGRLLVQARITVDATDLGDALPLSGTSYRLGMDARADTGEELAPAEANDVVQDLTVVAILKDYGPGADRTIERPAGYDPAEFAGCYDLSSEGVRSADRMLEYGRMPGGKYMINWPIEGNDYYVDMIDMTPEERADAVRRAKNHTLSFVYFLQHELGFNTLGLADDEFPTEDRLPFIPYHRESRRIHGAVRFTLNDITDPYAGTLYRTAVGVGDYPVDQHHTRYSGWDDLPDLYFHPIPSYGFPLGIVIPAGFPGLLVAEKSVSVTNLVNGSTRLQPVVLQIGQATGALAALAAAAGVDPSEVAVRRVQEAVLDAGGYLLPYLDLPAGDPRFKAMQRIGVTGILKGRGANVGWENQTWFDADRTIAESELREGLREVYPSVRSSVRETPVDGALLTAMLAEALGKPAGDIAAQTERAAAGLLSGYDPARPLTRLECALLIDAVADPFHAAEVDIYGNYKRK